MRHGRPEIETGRRLSSKEFGNWVKRYDSAKVAPDRPAPPETFDASAYFVVCSDLARSISSAALLNHPAELIDPLFREAELPHGNHELFRLTPAAWSIIYRIAWAGGFAPGVESVADTRKRADACARDLTALAIIHNQVLHIGHGSMIWFIARRLARLGWCGPKRAPREHWGFGIWERSKNS
jgi:broad specificity phosphatase PhoE